MAKIMVKTRRFMLVEALNTEQAINHVIYLDNQHIRYVYQYVLVMGTFDNISLGLIINRSNKSLDYCAESNDFYNREFAYFAEFFNWLEYHKKIGDVSKVLLYSDDMKKDESEFISKFKTIKSNYNICVPELREIFENLSFMV